MITRILLILMAMLFYLSNLDADENHSASTFIQQAPCIERASVYACAVSMHHLA